MHVSSTQLFDARETSSQLRANQHSRLSFLLYNLPFFRFIFYYCFLPPFLSWFFSFVSLSYFLLPLYSCSFLLPICTLLRYSLASSFLPICTLLRYSLASSFLPICTLLRYSLASSFLPICILLRYSLASSFLPICTLLRYSLASSFLPICIPDLFLLLICTLFHNSLSFYLYPCSPLILPSLFLPLSRLILEYADSALKKSKTHSEKVMSRIRH